MRRFLSLITLVAALASTSELRAQTTATQEVPVTIKVPFTLQRLYPSVTEIEFNCMLYVDGSTSIVGTARSPKMSVAQLQKAADGSISGEASAAGTATVPTTAAGKGGNYRCLPYVCVNTFCRQMSQYASGEPDYMLASTSAKIAVGTFTW